MMGSKGKRYGEGVENMIDANKIHMENLKKEFYYLDRNRTEHFQLNPNNGTLNPSSQLSFLVYIMPKKPNYVVPRNVKALDENLGAMGRNTFTEDPVEEAFSNEKLRRTL